MGFKEAALPMKERALAEAIGKQVRAALYEDRQIRAGHHRELDEAEVYN